MSAVTTTPDLPALAARLTGELHFDDTMRKLYATDASEYQEMPVAVALPKTEADVRDLLAVFDRCSVADDGDIFYPDVLVGLRELIPCDDITFQLMNVGEQRTDILFVTDEGVQREHLVGGADEYMQMFWQEFWNDDGCAGPLRTGDYATVLRHSDFWTEREYANTPLGSVRADLGLRHEVLVPMTPYGGTDRRLLLWRTEGPDFTERELMMLRLVRPHLAELHVYDNSAPADADGRAEPLPVLAMAHGQLQYPVSVAELLHTPDWAKPIVMRAMELDTPRD